MLNDSTFINIALEIAKWSKCISKQVWAVLVKDNRILSIWYNWTPSWYINCNDFWNFEDSKDHRAWSELYEIHAEMNVLLWAARKWISIEWADLFCTIQPCFQCTKNIIAAWIKRIVFKYEFKHTDSEIANKFIKDNWIEVLQIDSK